LWSDLFRSRYVRFLEAELNALRLRHAEDVATLKNLHAEEMNRCIVEANRGWAEADRLRQFLIPGIPQTVRTAPEPQADNSPVEEKELEHGTPYQRLLAKRQKEIQAAYEQAEAKEKIKFEAAKAAEAATAPS
jgi:hypothetical protein